MIRSSSQRIKTLVRLCCGLLLLFGDRLHAGGAGWNTIVVVNQFTSNSCAVGNYYSEKRAVPPENLLRINWQGGNISWTASDYSTYLLNPLLEMCSARSLTNQIDYVVLSMDIPFQVIENVTNINSTTSALFYGLKTNTSNGTPELGITNSYAGGEQMFRSNTPASATGKSFLATMITGSSCDEVKLMIDQGVVSDGASPPHPVILAKSSDVDRNVRHKRFDNAIFNAKVLSRSLLTRTNSNATLGFSNLMGFQTGLSQYGATPGMFSPGAIADSMTSFGGLIFGGNSQSNLLTFIAAGAAGSYGTVAEPGGDGNDFPDPQVYFYQSRGFSLAESYYQSIDTPYLGLMVAEPLAAPFSNLGSGRWNNGISNAILAGVAPLGVQFRAHDATRPLQQIDLVLNGKYLTTLTNLSPMSGNKLAVTLNGYPINYEVGTNFTLKTIASGLASLINSPAVTNATKIRALAYGDRIELQSISTNHDSFPFYATNHSSTVITGAAYRVRNLNESFPPRITPTGWNRAGNYGIRMEIPTSLPYIIQASTNLVDWQPIFTNIESGVIEFHDNYSTNYLRRFYRVAGPKVDQPPIISAPAFTNGGGFRLRMESQIGQPVAILVSSNHFDWYAAETNKAGGVIDWVDQNASSFPARYYRAWLVPTPQPSLTLSNSTTNTTYVRVDDAIQPYAVEYCTNGLDWVGVVTNFSFRDIQTTVNSSVGSATNLTTFVHAIQPVFMTTSACGVEDYRVNASTLAAGAWMRFTFTKTNGQNVVVAATNTVTGGNSTNLAAQIVTLINSNVDLQGQDGLVAEDFQVDSIVARFSLRSRSPGFRAAQIKVMPGKSSPGPMIIPSSTRMLVKNIYDLQPRNHLYVTSGSDELDVNFTLDTTTIPDGYHELTAVAYEGSSVRTQTRTTIPVQIQNTSLTATMTLVDLTNNAPVQGSYQIHVVANTNNVSAITLFSTGGQIGLATNVSDVFFTVHGTNLWEGLHPFYTVVEAQSGEKYRTRTEWIRLSP